MNEIVTIIERYITKRGPGKYFIHKDKFDEAFTALVLQLILAKGWKRKDIEFGPANALQFELIFDEAWLWLHARCWSGKTILENGREIAEIVPVRNDTEYKMQIWHNVLKAMP